MPGPYPGSAQNGYFFKLKVYERDLVEVYKRVGKFVIVVCEQLKKG